MQYPRTIAVNGHSWHLTLPRRELIKRKMTPGTILIVNFDEAGFRVDLMSKFTEAPLSDPGGRDARQK